VKYLLKLIQEDSQKQVDFGRAALKILEFKRNVGLQEKKEVWEFLRKHGDMEKKHREFVAEIRSLTKTARMKYIFEQIWAEERKPRAILETLLAKRFEKDAA